MTPHVVDGVTLSDQTDFAVLALDVLRGGGGGLRSDNWPLDWILRAYRELAGSPYADLLAEGIAVCLTALEPEVRAQALIFFQTTPRAAGGDRVCDLLAGDRPLFRGVPDPIHPGTDLEWQLLAALAARIGIGDARAVELARGEVVQPGRAAPIIAELATADRDWVVANAEAIVRGTPAAGATLLIQLQAAVSGFIELARRVVPWCHGDARFELDISRFIDEPSVRVQLLELFQASAGESSRSSSLPS